MLACLCFGFAEAYGKGYRNFTDASALGYVLGYGAGLFAILAIIVGIYAGIKRLFSKKRGESLAGITWTTWVILVFLIEYGHFPQYQEARKVSEDDREVLRDIADAFEKRLEGGELGDLDVNVESDSQLMADFMARHLPEARRLEATIHATIEMPQLYTPEFLRNRDFASARRTPGEIDATYGKNRAERLELLARMRQDIKSVALPEG